MIEEELIEEDGEMIFTITLVNLDSLEDILEDTDQCLTEIPITARHQEEEDDEKVFKEGKRAMA